MEFQLDNFKGKVEEPIGKTISFLKVIGKNRESGFVPIIFWLTTNNEQCNRFFIDSWILHWSEYSKIEMDEIIKEDFDKSNLYKVRDLMMQYQLQGKRIENIEMDYIKKSEELIGKLRIEIEGNRIIELLDFGDKKAQELKISLY